MIAGLLIALGIAAAQPATPRPDAAAAGVEYEVFYHHTLRNRTDRELRDVIVYLPVPQSDACQRVEGFRIERNTPVHISNRTDAFGTKIKRVAVASIPPKGEVEVGFSCTVRLSPPAKVNLEPAKAAAADALDTIPRDIRDTYTRDHAVFGLGTAIIKDTGARLLREHPNPVHRARAIHDLIASTFKYRSEDGWDPAPEVFQRREGSCSEFSYVFCALCRATGIPTRFVGASICPREPAAADAPEGGPFQDKGWHRWAEAYLPGHGWVPFDPTLDRGKPAKQGFVGTHHGRTLILTRTGDKSLQLGLSYIGANSHTGETTRARWFTWSRGTGAELERALRPRGSGKPDEAALRALVARWPGTRTALEASRVLRKLAHAADSPAPPQDTPDPPG
ncbi:MAG: transglutaminase family protein [Phycisphaerales bacterium]